ncbi:MAG TPA: fructosamine kinase family protein, partial [Chitinophagaceae bacterium]
MTMIRDPESYLSHRLQQENLTIQPVGGGCINDCYKVSTSQRSFFCKINSASKFPHLFEREAEGLQLLEMNGSIRTPSVIDYFTYNDNQVLVLEWIFPGENSTSFWKLL